MAKPKRGGSWDTIRAYRAMTGQVETPMCPGVCHDCGGSGWRTQSYGAAKFQVECECRG